MAFSVGKHFTRLKFIGLLFVPVLLFCFVLDLRNIWGTGKFSSVKIEEETRGLPIWLVIPKIDVKARIVAVGVNKNGEMGTPNNSVDVGWFEMGPRPGDTGSAVIDGHFDSEKGDDGVFFNLDQLKIGDRIEVINSEGETFAFVVKGTRKYMPGNVKEVFNQSDGVHLNLITCDGVWDGSKKGFTKRLVIFTDLAEYY